MSFSLSCNDSGRKRRPSDCEEEDDDPVMDDCMAAMVLMSLSCSPKSPLLLPDVESKLYIDTYSDYLSNKIR